MSRKPGLGHPIVKAANQSAGRESPSLLLAEDEVDGVSDQHRAHDDDPTTMSVPGTRPSIDTNNPGPP